MKKIYFIPGMILIVLMLQVFCAKQENRSAADNSTSEKKDIEYISRADLKDAIKNRRNTMIGYFADAPARGYMDIAAKLYSNKNVDSAIKQLRTLMENPRGDMFWMYPFITVTFAGRHVLPDEVKKEMRELWLTYTPYRGDTENHWAMYYTAMYLITQMYPDEPGSSWFTGKNSEENFKEAEEYLISWMDLATTIGQGEFDSPDYYGVYIIPMCQLYAYAEDPVMKKRAEMMLDLLVADFSAENLDGFYCGAHSRIYPVPVLEGWKSSSAIFSWFLFGNTPYRPRGDVAVLAMSGYEPAEILYHIATDRTVPYVQKERKRTRHRIRWSEEKNAPVYKYTYMRKEYGIGSLQGGLLQPIQQHSWDITWAIDDPKEGFNTLFCLHPYSDGYELTMYFPEEIKLMIEGVMKSKNTYDLPDKWTGASPYEKIFQHKDAVIALYNIPEGTRFPHISGFFPKVLIKRDVDDESGWIFCHGGDAYIAYYPLSEYEWQEEDKNWRLHSTILKNGAVVQAAPAGDFSTFEEFKKKIKSLNLETKTDPAPHAVFTTLDGSKMEFTYGENPKLNGTPVDYEGWKLYDGPFMFAEKGSKKIELKYGSLRRVLDFNSLTITEYTVK